MVSTVQTRPSINGEIVIPVTQEMDLAAGNSVISLNKSQGR